jgi:hypothetical protein
MFAKTVAPVVVKPETDSKKASAKVGTAPESQKGKEPMAEAKIHDNPTATKASFGLISSLLSLPPMRSNIAPKAMPMIMETNMGLASGDLSRTAQPRGSNINKDTTSTINPRIFVMILNRISFFPLFYIFICWSFFFYEQI